MTSITTRKKQNSFKTLKKESSVAWRDNYTWIGIALATVTAILFVISGLIMLSLHSTATGWLLVGTGLLLVFLIIIVIMVYHKLRIAEHQKRIEDASANSVSFFWFYF